MERAIFVQGLTKRFSHTTALENVSFQADTGTVLGLLGPNGAGKTTAVRVMATLLKPDAGEVRIGGHDVSGQAHLVRQHIGLTGQYASVDEKLTGEENLVLVGRLLGLPRREAYRRARQLLSDFHLEEAAGRAAKTYSGGMRRRLDLAISLIGRPEILFLDEPTTGLDPRARLNLWSLIRRLVADGTTVLLTTQYLEEADQLADDIVVLDRGRTIATGSPELLKQQIGSKTLVVQARREQDLAVIATILAELTGTRPETDGLTASVPASDPDHLPALVRRLDTAGIAVNELMLRSASLDDVFLTLTGRHAEPLHGDSTQTESTA